MSVQNSKQFAVNWKHHTEHIKTQIDELLNTTELCDVTIFVDQRPLRAHKIILSACSLYFRNVFREIYQDNPIVIIKGIGYDIMENILRFMYNGEICIDTELFNDFIQAAQSLEVSGLTTNDYKVNDSTNLDAKEEMVRKRHITSKNVDESKKIKRSENEDSRDDEDPRILKHVLDVSLINEEFEIEPGPELPNKDIKEEQHITKSDYSEDYTCDICGKKYRLKDSLYKHLSVHDGSTTCMICSKVLSRKTHLDRHMLVTHGISSSNKYTDLNVKKE